MLCLWPHFAAKPEGNMNKADKEALAEYRADMAVIAEQASTEAAENERREWAQRNGNDSGFDPYWNID